MAVSVTMQCERAAKDFLMAEICGTGTLGIIEEDSPDGRHLLRVFFEDEDEASAIAARFPAYTPALRREETQDWVRMARNQWQPVLVGERFYLTPSWRHEPAPPGRFRVPMPPGTASGTGLHATTKLAIEALDRSVHPGDSVLDLGTGSGILSASARLLGAGRVIACDIDEQAVSAAREYLGRDAAVFTGSARSLGPESMDVVVANISATVITGLAAEIARVLRPDGRAVLGGFTGADLPRLNPSLQAARLAVKETISREEWICLLADPET